MLYQSEVGTAMMFSCTWWRSSSSKYDIGRLTKVIKKVISVVGLVGGCDWKAEINHQV